MTIVKSHEERIRNARDVVNLFTAMHTISLNGNFSGPNQESAKVIINGFIKDCCDNFMIDLSEFNSVDDRLREREVRAIEIDALLQIMSNYNYIDVSLQELAKDAVSIFANYASGNSFSIGMLFEEGNGISISDVRQLEMRCLIKIMNDPSLIDGPMEERLTSAIQSYFIDVTNVVNKAIQK